MVDLNKLMTERGLGKEVEGRNVLRAARDYIEAESHDRICTERTWQIKTNNAQSL